MYRYALVCALCIAMCIAMCIAHTVRAVCTTPYLVGDVYRVPCTVHRAPCTVHRAPCTVYRAPCTVCTTPYLVGGGVDGGAVAQVYGVAVHLRSQRPHHLRRLLVPRLVDVPQDQLTLQHGKPACQQPAQPAPCNTHAHNGHAGTCRS